MLVVPRSLQTPSVKHLVKIWAERYMPILPDLSSTTDPLSLSSLFEAASSEGRAFTAAKLSEPFIEVNCQMAGMQTNFLYANIPNIVDLDEARQLTRCTLQVYKKVVEIYRQQSLPSILLTTRQLAPTVGSEGVSLSAWGMPTLEELATVLEPVLLALQEQHVISKNWRTLGFITTLLNFSSNLILRRLTPIEEVLLKPYFKFIEEQVALPWQRVCAAAAKHSLTSPNLILVEQMLPKSHEIAQKVYRQLVRSNSNHHSRRGGLSNPEIAHSIIRDLEMFQSYLWLCVLEESLEPVELELIDLCVMVMTGMDVKWELTEQFIHQLMDEVLNHATPDQMKILLPYIQGIQKAFFEERLRLGAAPRPSQPVSQEQLRFNVALRASQPTSDLQQADYMHKDKEDNSSREIERLAQKLSDLDQELADAREQLAMHLKNPQLHKRIAQESQSVRPLSSGFGWRTTPRSNPYSIS